MSLRNLLLNTLCLSLVLFLQQKVQAQNERTYWDDVSNQTVKSFSRYKWPDEFRAFSINENNLRAQLANAPFEQLPLPANYGVALSVPMPNGTIEEFRVYEVPTMEPGLAAKFPTFKTYAGIGTTDARLRIRISLTDLGFQALIATPDDHIYIDPVTTFPNSGYYLEYKRKDLPRTSGFICETEELGKEIQKSTSIPLTTAQRSTGTQLRTYRLALACTGEYSAYYGGTVSGALSGIVASMNRVNYVYETEVDIRMVLIANNNLLVYLNAATDPYTNNNGSTMLNENQTNINNVIGTANYDIGHVFSTGGGGIAQLNSPCTTSKARGVTGSGSPVGDAFDIDYVAHEMGHQFGGFHTFNGTTGSCGGGNRSSSAAYEPGSGVTIMAYAGICGVENLASNSIAYFHTFSYDQIITFSTGTTGNSCAVVSSTGNNPPSISLGSPLSYSIPYLTPFQLTGSATDPDGDAVTYSWEQFDLGTATTSASLTSADGPIFRPFNPTTSPTRIFPKLSDILSNTATYGESLPTAARNMKFRLTVRDNKTGGGGVNNGTDTVKIAVINTGAAFAVTSPNTAVTWLTNNTQTVTWNVSQTTASPISCANVKISLSTDGGQTWPFVLAASTANDGTENVLMPNAPTTTARIKVEAVGNIFFDISNTNFTLQSSTSVLTSITCSLTSGNFCAGDVFSLNFFGDGPPNAGNVYTAQLSNASGSFTTPVTIGTLTSTATSGTISCTIPAGVASGSAYRVRVVSSSPAVTGSNNGSNLIIGGTLGSIGSISGPASVALGSTGNVYTVPAVTNATAYTWTVPPGATITAGATTNSITVTFSGSATSGSFTVKASNSCYTSNTVNYAVVVGGLPFPAGAITGPASVCAGSSGNVYSTTTVSNATSYLWTLPAGASIVSGANTTSITVAFALNASSGSISVNPVNASGNGAGSSLSVNVSPAATPVTVSPSGPVISCGPVSLTFTPQAGNSYKWQFNGVDNGNTSAAQSATQSGNYAVSTTSIAPRTFSNTGVFSIPDNSCTSVSSAITINNYNANVASSSIYVRLNITHTWIGDLTLILEAPNGQLLGLCNQLGSSGDNFVNTVFADSGSAAIPATGAPYTGLYKPSTAVFSSCLTTTITTFAALGGGAINPNGTWKLWAFDRAAQDVGTINDWTIGLPGASYGCSSLSNVVAVSIQSPPTVSSFSPAAAPVGGLVTINGTNLNGTTGVNFNGVAASFTVVNAQQITATVPSAATSGTLQIVHPCSTMNAGTFTVSATAVNLQVRVFIQGFYSGAGTMVNLVAPSVTDTLYLELHAPTAPYSLLYSGVAVVNATGYANFSFPIATNGNTYYLAVRHRNSLQIWSKTPVLLSPTTFYNFTQ